MTTYTRKLGKVSCFSARELLAYYYFVVCSTTHFSLHFGYLWPVWPAFIILGLTGLMRRPAICLGMILHEWAKTEKWPNLIPKNRVTLR